MFTQNGFVLFIIERKRNTSSPLGRGLELCWKPAQQESEPDILLLGDFGFEFFAICAKVAS